jgi:integrase
LPSNKSIVMKTPMTKKKQTKADNRKEPIHIRQRQLKHGNVSLFLDKWWNSKHSYEFLNLYLVRELSQVDREQNKATWLLAETIKAQRIQELQKEANGFPSFKTDYSFIEYFRLQMNARYNSKGNYGSWDSALKHLLIFTKDEDVKFKQVDADWLGKFKCYLQNATIVKSEIIKLKPNSQYSYYNKVKAALRQAYDDGYIPMNPASRLRGIKPGESNRERLTLEEVQRLVVTPCDNELIKVAFLFSVLTGLRWSDVSAIMWRQVQYSELTGNFIQFIQQKTDQQEFLPISMQARDLLGEAKESGTKVFERLVYKRVSTILSRWMLRAGILKHITFHCARHTHATLLLELGVDIYVLSKMLGHKKITTTEIYAKVSPHKKMDAANRIPSLDLKNLARKQPEQDLSSVGNEDSLSSESHDRRSSTQTTFCCSPASEGIEWRRYGDDLGRRS